jgi:hypothetical protein
MATVTKVNGDSQVVVNVGDSLSKNANAVIINTGIASPIKAYKITTLGITANLANELKGPSPAGLTGAVDTLLRTITSNATVLAYQVDVNSTTSQLSVIVERNSWASDLALQTAVRALGANIGAFGVVNMSAAAVSTTTGIKIA